MISALCVASLLSFVAGVQHASLLSRPTTPSHVCTRACTFKHTSTLALEPRFFIDQVISRLHTRDLGLVTEPRKVATAYLTKQAMESCIEGDVVETGLFTGGSSVVIMSALMDMDACHRIFWGFDSFEGLPAAVEQDQNGTLLVGAKAEYRTGQDVYEGNLKALGAWDSRIRVVKGFFSVAIPTVSNKIKAIAFLRLDGDMYVSTKDVLDLLYDKVVVGGFIYVDDYGSFNGCRRAVDEFRLARNISAPLHNITEDNGAVEAVWWRRLQTA